MVVRFHLLLSYSSVAMLSFTVPSCNSHLKNRLPSAMYPTERPRFCGRAMTRPSPSKEPEERVKFNSPRKGFVWPWAPRRAPGPPSSCSRPRCCVQSSRRWMRSCRQSPEHLHTSEASWKLMWCQGEQRKTKAHHIRRWKAMASAQLLGPGRIRSKARQTWPTSKGTTVLHQWVPSASRSQDNGVATRQWESFRPLVPQRNPGPLSSLRSFSWTVAPTSRRRTVEARKRRRRLNGHFGEWSGWPARSPNMNALDKRFKKAFFFTRATKSGWTWHFTQTPEARATARPSTAQDMLEACCVEGTLAGSAGSQYRCFPSPPAKDRAADNCQRYPAHAQDARRHAQGDLDGEGDGAHERHAHSSASAARATPPNCHRRWDPPNHPPQQGGPPSGDVALRSPLAPCRTSRQANRAAKCVCGKAAADVKESESTVHQMLNMVFRNARVDITKGTSTRPIFAQTHVERSDMATWSFQKHGAVQWRRQSASSAFRDHKVIPEAGQQDQEAIIRLGPHGPSNRHKKFQPSIELLRVAAVVVGQSGMPINVNFWQVSRVGWIQACSMVLLMPAIQNKVELRALGPDARWAASLQASDE